MNILSWNLNGIKASLNRGDFEQLKSLPLLDVICFQETRTHEEPVILKEYHHHWYHADKKGYSGTLVLTLVEPLKVIRGMGIPELDSEGRLLTLDMGMAYVVNTYMPKSQGRPGREEYRRKWDEAYRVFLLNLASEKPVIACGDYNVTMERKDIYAENTRMSWAEQGYISDERANLMRLLDEGFTDAYRHLYPNQENAFTWWSNRRNKRKDGRGWRLDYFLVSDDIKGQISDVVIHDEIIGSDHCPIVLDCSFEDKEYATKYADALKENEKKAEEEKKLARMWMGRKRYFDSYKEKLALIQSEITVYSSLHENEKVRQLQTKIMDDIRFKCLAVNRVTASYTAPGIDDVIWKTDADKMRAAMDLEWRNYEASPKRIIEIKSKYSDKKRRTGILTYRDKAMSILCGYTFAPIEEAYADHRSYAFRPGRSRQDAIINAACLFDGDEAPSYFVYIDIQGFYASLQHRWIMEHVPMPKDVLRAFLKAGHIFAGELFPGKDAGISEGSPLSPMVSNFALDGLQRAIYRGLHGKTTDIDFRNGAMVRYADDVLVSVRTAEDAQAVLGIIVSFLEPRGLVISDEKKAIGHIYDGVDMIGFTIKKAEYTVTVRPKQEAVQRFINGIHDTILDHRGSQRDLIKLLNRKLKGWAGQYRFCDAHKSYHDIDAAVTAALLEAAMRKHPKTPKKKLIDRYWYTDENKRQWYCLPKEKSTRVIHLVDTLLISASKRKKLVNPYLEMNYYAQKKEAENIERINAKYHPVWERQEGKCLYCGRLLLPDQPKKLILIDHTKKDALWNKAYIHEVCGQDDYQFFLTLEDVGNMTDFDVREVLERIHTYDSVIRDERLPEDWKYMKLYDYFAECTKPKVMLKFSAIEEILGFELTESQKTNHVRWYSRKEFHAMADAWNMNGYKLKRLYLKEQKVSFEAQFEDAQRVVIPSEIQDYKVPAQAKYEIEHYLAQVIKKYGLVKEDVIPRKKK